MDQVKNGIFYRNGTPQIALGTGYYASFHPHKYQVPPDGDRIGEMKKDLAQMKELGFDLVRTSALGRLYLKDDEVQGDLAFPDALAKEAERLGISVMMRLNDYSMNLHAEPDEISRRNKHGERQRRYSSFMQDCIHHPTVIEDNRIATRFLAAHYADYPSVVLHLIYNEPGYGHESFDYHPCAIAAFRKWLVDTGRMTEEEARFLDAPRRRPFYNESPAMWVNWRLFSTNALSHYLGDTGVWARKGNPNVEGMTCTMQVIVCTGGVHVGEDIFDMAREMDIVGINDYLPCFGEPIWYSLMYLDCVASAARLYGKHIWAAECNAHTTLSGEEWERETYTMLGGGLKGLVYYQWRADYDNGKGPEIGEYGILHNNREKTEKYPAIAPMNALVHRIGEKLAQAELKFSPVAVLFSQHANAWYDARENGSGYPYIDSQDDFNPGENMTGLDRNVIYMQMIHRELRKLGHVPAFVRAEDLQENRLGIRALYVPSAPALSAQEKEQILAFAKAGGLVFDYQPSDRTHGYSLLPACKGAQPIHRHSRASALAHSCRIEDTLYLAGIEKSWQLRADPDTLCMNLLSGQGYTVAAITNYDTFERPVRNAALYLKKVDFPGIKTARFMTPKRDMEIAIKEEEEESYIISLPEIHTGCFVLLEE